MATIQASDVLPVRSRISWSAVLAGAVIALTAYLILFVLGVAMGLSFGDRMSTRAFGATAGIWAVVSMLVALFIGGCVCSRCTAGENKAEAVMSGVVVWGVVFFMLAWLSSGALNTGLHAAFGAVGTANQSSSNGNIFSEQSLKEAGFSDKQITAMRAQFDQFRNRVANPSDQDTTEARKHATAAAWWALTGIILSLAASVIGALVGAGPTLIVTSLRLRGATVVAENPTRETAVRT